MYFQNIFLPFRHTKKIRTEGLLLCPVMNFNGFDDFFTALGLKLSRKFELADSNFLSCKAIKLSFRRNLAQNFRI